jgi:replicase family protein/primase-like protein
MPHDIDHAGAYFAHRDANLPEPNVICINPDNGHGHSAVLLVAPVARHSAARIEPLRFYGAVERGIARRLDADRHYSGLITKNPVHPHWRVEWRRDDPYTLSELADWLFFEDMRPDATIETTLGAGRNCTVFDELRHIAYREVLAFKRDGSLEGWASRCEGRAVALNQRFPQPMRQSEVRVIARSVARWTWRNFSGEKFSARQRHRVKIRWADHISTEHKTLAHRRHLTSDMVSPEGGAAMTTKTKFCTACGRTLSFDAFPKTRNRAGSRRRKSKCKACSNRYSRQYRRENESVRVHDRARAKLPQRREALRKNAARWRANNPDAVKAYNKLWNALRRGRMKRFPCEVCGHPKVHGHHRDYAKPFDVVWLCARHHHQAHGLQQPRATIISRQRAAR